MNESLAVVGPRFCSEKDAVLLMKQKRSYSNDDFEVHNTETGALLFKIDGKAFSLAGERTVEEGNGLAIATMKHAIFEGWTPRMKVEGQDFSFEVIKKAKFQSEAKAAVRDLLTGQQLTVYMYGDWTARNMKLYLGKRTQGGRLLASCERPRTFFQLMETYHLTVLPGVDSALCVLMCVAFDEFFNPRNND